jgi:hypothetical protein
MDSPAVSNRHDSGATAHIWLTDASAAMQLLLHNFSAVVV